MGPPKKICKAKVFGEFCRVPEKIAQRVLWEVIYGAPAKIFAKQKDLWGKERRASEQSRERSERLAKFAPPRRGAADRPRTDTPFGTGS